MRVELDANWVILFLNHDVLLALGTTITCKSAQSWIILQK